jgi:glutaminase
MEPSGDDFNSMLKLELVEPGKPFNPLINAGAIVISSLIKGSTPEDKSKRILNFIHSVIHSFVDDRQSEHAHSHITIHFDWEHRQQSLDKLSTI